MRHSIMFTLTERIVSMVNFPGRTCHLFCSEAKNQGQYFVCPVLQNLQITEQGRSPKSLGEKKSLSCHINLLRTCIKVLSFRDLMLRAKTLTYPLLNIWLNLCFSFIWHFKATYLYLYHFFFFILSLGFSGPWVMFSKNPIGESLLFLFFNLLLQLSCNVSVEVHIKNTKIFNYIHYFCDNDIP